MQELVNEDLKRNGWYLTGSRTRLILTSSKRKRKGSIVCPRLLSLHQMLAILAGTNQKHGLEFCHICVCSTRSLKTTSFHLTNASMTGTTERKRMPAILLYAQRHLRSSVPTNSMTHSSTRSRIHTPVYTKKLEKETSGEGVKSSSWVIILIVVALYVLPNQPLGRGLCSWLS